MRVPIVGITTFAVLISGCASTPRPPLTEAECAEKHVIDEAKLASDFEESYLRALGPPRPPEPDDTARLDSRPRLINGPGIQVEMGRLYPPALLFANRGGTAELSFIVRFDGTPNPIRLLHSTGETALDLASVAVAHVFRFAPGIYRGCAVNVLVQMPITWVPPRPRPSDPPPGRP